MPRPFSSPVSLSSSVRGQQAPRQDSRSLFLLSTIAFREARYDHAGCLFAAAMNSADADEFLQEVGEVTVLASELNSQVLASSGLASDQGQAMSVWMGEEDTDFRKSSLSGGESGSGDEPEGLASEDYEDGEDPEDGEDEEYEDDLTSDDEDPDVPGQNVVPSSISLSVSGVPRTRPSVEVEVEESISTAGSPVEYEVPLQLESKNRTSVLSSSRARVEPSRNPVKMRQAVLTNPVRVGKPRD